MTPERWAQIDGLLAEALEQPAAERAAFLTAACGDDAALRREVASLLTAHAAAEGDFLTPLALEATVRDLAAEQSHSLVGTTFGHYRVLSVLGVGGMGEVYLAQDTRLQRKVGLKLLPAEYTQDAARIKRFEREALAASALNHPNIITIYEIGQEDGKHFIAAEYVDGQTLRALLARGRLALKDISEIAVQIAAALAAAHEAGIIHRDIKPENVMVRRDDYVKVLDFGLAKLTEKHRTLAETRGDGSDPAVTNPGVVMGTVRYMSPEQALGRDVDVRSDIFSLGVVLYELLAGSPPFKGDTPAAVLDAVVHHTPLPLTQVRPDLSVEFERIVSHMLEKDRDLRYQTAGDLRAVLKRLKRELDSAPTHSSNSKNDSRKLAAAKSAGSPWRRVQAVAAIVVVLATLGFAAWRLWPDGAREPSPWLNAYNSPLTTFPGEERYPSLSPDGKQVYYARAVNGQWDVFWQRIGGNNATNLTAGSDADDEQPACSPDGDSLVFRSARQGGGLFVTGATGENVRKISGFGHNPAWSPDGKQVVCGTDFILDPRRRVATSKLLIVDVATSQERLLVGNGDAAQPKWSPGGQRIAYFFRAANNQADIWTIRADGGDPRPVTNDAAVDWNPVWSGDGKYLYFASDRKNVASLWRVRIDEAAGRVLGEPEAVNGQSGEVLQMDVARDGRRIVYTTRVQDANIKSIGYDPVRKHTVGEPIYLTRGSRPSGSPNISPDGQWVAFHTLGAAQEDIWLRRSDGSGQEINLTNDSFLDRSPRWSPDGKQLAFFSNRAGPFQIWLINPDGSNLRQLTFDKVGCQFPFWSPDGKRLGYQSSDNIHGTRIIEVDKPWEQQTPVELPPVKSTGEWFNGYTWSPDGKLIAGQIIEVHGKEVRSQLGIWVYSLQTRSYKQLTEIGFRPEWLSDSRHLIFSNHGTGKIADYKLWLVDSQTNIFKPLLPHPTNLISTLGVLSDSRRIFFTATDHQSDIFLLSLDK